MRPPEIVRFDSVSYLSPFSHCRWRRLAAPFLLIDALRRASIRRLKHAERRREAVNPARTLEIARNSARFVRRPLYRRPGWRAHHHDRFERLVGRRSISLEVRPVDTSRDGQ
jgi:hypothetical protein